MISAEYAKKSRIQIFALFRSAEKASYVSAKGIKAISAIRD